MKTKTKSEIQIQAECYLWFHNTFPELRGLLCYNLNNSANPIQGNQNKQLGLQKGRSDMVFYYKGKAYMIEFKTEEGTQQKKQIEWQNKIRGQGFMYFIVRSKEQFKELIEYLIML